jgi:SanA protein
MTTPPQSADQIATTNTDATPIAASKVATLAAKPQRWQRWLWRGALAMGGGLLGLGLCLALIDLSISLSTRDAITESVDAVEPASVALILGTSRTFRGKPNPFYRARIEAAAELFHRGHVRGILVSGDNATRYYNEPITMQKDLIAEGVPAEVMTLDYAGFRTLDSVVRAKEVFGLDHVLVVSQRFHVARAIFLARHFGIDAHGFAASDPNTLGFIKIRAREVLARAAAVLDILTGQGPRYLGKPEAVRLREPPAAPAPEAVEPAVEITAQTNEPARDSQTAAEASSTGTEQQPEDEPQQRQE